jgi:hypothetical protein
MNICNHVIKNHDRDEGKVVMFSIRELHLYLETFIIAWNICVTDDYRHLPFDVVTIFVRNLSRDI